MSTFVMCTRHGSIFLLSSRIPQFELVSLALVVLGYVPEAQPDRRLRVLLEISPCKHTESRRLAYSRLAYDTNFKESLVVPEPSRFLDQ
jgi:hypothetical protein